VLIFQREENFLYVEISDRASSNDRAQTFKRTDGLAKSQPIGVFVEKFF
jgi:hypothetical protein